MSPDEKTLQNMLTDWSKALEAGDLDAMLSDYAADVVLFDACPPYKTEGIDAVRKVWEHCLPYFPENFRSEHRDLEFHVDGKVAMVHGVHHFVTEPADHPCGMTWMRVTIGYRKIEGQWKVMHEHISIPFNPMTQEACYIKDPDHLAMPNDECN